MARVSQGKIPFLVLAIVSSVVTFLVQRRGGAVSSLTGVPIWARFGNALISYVRYIAKIILAGATFTALSPPRLLALVASGRQRSYCWSPSRCGCICARANNRIWPWAGFGSWPCWRQQLVWSRWAFSRWPTVTATSPTSVYLIMVTWAAANGYTSAIGFSDSRHFGAWGMCHPDPSAGGLLAQ